MITNKEIANTFNDLAKIMELHKENPYKIRSYQNAYVQLRKIEQPLVEMSDQEISGIKGVGKAISSKIRELQDSGTLATLEKYKAKTPPGIQDLLGLKGFGPKKIRTLWDELGIESAGELLYACNENRLIELKGFGHKTQEDLRQKLEYFLQSKNKFHYASLEREALLLIEQLQEKLPAAKIELTGAIRRRATILDRIELLIASKAPIDSIFDGHLLSLDKQEEQRYIARNESGIPIEIFHCAPEAFGSKQFRYTSTDDFLKAFLKAVPGMDFKDLADEQLIFEKADMAFIPPELRESGDYIERAKKRQLPDLITTEAITGVVHSHTTYSDGLHSLAEMAQYTQKEGFGYILITDHSKSAFYANGLKEDRVLEQMAAIDELNQQMAPFRILKGIESDILADGSLDYADELLQKFDVVIASVHSNLKMDEEKATTRLLKAIENPYTHILGHPTGRLLLSRQGYPIDHKKIIDACAASKVAIELNANPYRLDLDWTWIPYALEKGVWISINPDAHSREGIHHIRFGVLAARKGGLPKDRCLNALSVDAFLEALKKG